MPMHILSLVSGEFKIKLFMVCARQNVITELMETTV